MVGAFLSRSGILCLCVLVVSAASRQRAVQTCSKSWPSFNGVQKGVVDKGAELFDSYITAVCLSAYRWHCRLLWAWYCLTCVGLIS